MRDGLESRMSIFNIFRRKKSVMKEDANKGNRMQDNSGGGFGGNGGGKKNNNDNGGDDKEQRRGPNIMIFVIVTFIALLVISYFVSRSSSKSEEITYDQFLTMVSENKVESISIEADRVIITEKAKGDSKFDIGQTYFTGLAEDSTTLTGRMLDSGVEVSSKVESGSNLIINILLTYVLPLVILWVALGFIFNRIGRSGGFGFGVGRSNAKMYEGKETGITFKDVAGEDEAKESLVEIVDFLHNPDKYSKIGAKIPKGGLLVGPPGTGKTLLAKAVAGEAGVPFFSLAGSDFVELYVGVGASRVRDLFEDAKKNAPAIVFIDEIDAVARRRGTGMGGGHDEREQTLNQLLVEMDGFGVNEGIIVMAATNRIDILDPAILRPGRFDRRIGVGSPDVQGREDILKVHSRNKPLAEDVDLEQIARTTAGFTGADLENLMNEAAILTAREGRKYITQEDVKASFVKVGIGSEKKSKIVSDKEKKITAYHESGHAILFHLLPDVGPVYSVSIIPTGMGAAGYTMPLPERDEMFNTKGRMLQDIVVSLGGRVAESLVFDDITTGASQDIKQATKTAKKMVMKYGMSDKIGIISYDNDDDEVFIGRDLAHSTRGYSEEVAGKIDEEVKRIITECYEKAERIIRDNMDILHKSAELLLEKEKISREEFEALFQQKTAEPVAEG